MQDTESSRPAPLAPVPFDPASTPDWIGPLDRAAGPLYAQILAALEDAVARGVLRPGERLPTQRALAEQLQVDLTTVTRAYSEARHRGLIDAVTGRGSFIPGGSGAAVPALDLSMLMPPPPRGLSLGALVERGLASLLARSNADVLMAYHIGPGAAPDRLAATQWLEPVLGAVDPRRVVVTPGTQPALAALLSMLAQPGEVILAEPETYPGFLAASAALRLAVTPVACDAQGLEPEALARACETLKPRALYIQPTIQNPTTRTMPPARRHEIAAVASAYRLTVIEDDPYSRLIDRPAPALAALLPESAYHVATLAKCLTPGLRTAFVTVPQREDPERLAAALRALTLMPAPLMSALATRWIATGTATHLLGAIRREARERQRLARDLLPAGSHAHPDGLHVWQPLPARWDSARLIEAARRQGLGIMPAEAFSVDGTARRAVRIALGAVADRARLAEALGGLAALIEGKEERSGARG
ncbi:aminotransferase-like domain-containing protein [Ancylobacter mangrovi]|uniref:aminotransferase-like domain-containing protein n=1 Tax=Ancylobacter mangrovi TaxID=2972472 RepID=UPI0021617DB1|nr:PLP-dependent aminotransferase family protein [Ancylobacter mangrovi]MCS0502996.1 PLP-dependent aminotransferase family protein [Ancylobacter mangrovi]